MPDKQQYPFNPFEAVKDLKVCAALLEFQIALCADLNIMRDFENKLKKLSKQAEEKRMSLQVKP